MSLLMDALRRAEQEKKQQAGQAPAEVGSPGAPETDDTMASLKQPTTVQSPYAGSEDVTMQIEPAEVQRAEAMAEQSAYDRTASMSAPIPEIGSPAEATTDGDQSQAFDLGGDDSQLLDTSLVIDEQALEEQGGLSLEPIDTDPGGIAGDDTNTHSMSMSADLTGGDRIDQTTTMPSTKAVNDDLNAYFEQSQSMEVPRPGPGNAGDRALENVAAHTVVGAQTIFSAKERPRSKRLLVAAAVIAVGVVVSIGVVGLFYAQRSPGPRTVPTPAVADGIERPPTRELPAVPLAPPVVDTKTEIARIETTIVSAGDATTTPGTAVATADTLTAAADTMMPAGPDTTGTTDAAGQAETAAVEARLAEVASAQVAAVEAPPLAAPEPAAVEARAPTISEAAAASVGRNDAAGSHATPLRDVGAGELTIARKQKPAAINAQIATAYAAFQSGNYDQAQSDYAEVVAGDPRNRDALLGLGAIAVSRGDFEAAWGHYHQVLTHHPGDATATAAIFSISGGNDPASAARLRVLLDTYHDSPDMHFALGNWFARKGRWGDAQQAYFNAVRLDGQNADYAYNLAVSLDHLGQQDAATDYYQKAITLADDAGASFNAAAALARINALSSSASP